MNERPQQGQRISSADGAITAYWFARIVAGDEIVCRADFHYYFDPERKLEGNRYVRTSDPNRPWTPSASSS